MTAAAGTGSEVIWIDGRPATAVAALDRGLHYGDGLFETIACLRGRPRFLSLHLERLMQGCRALRIQLENVAEIRAEIQALASDVERAVVKVLVTRGTATARGYAPGSESATRITIRYPWPHPAPTVSRDGVKVRTVQLRLGENPRLAGLKHCNRLEQILARMEWAQTDAAEGLLFSHSGNLVSGTMSNVFLVRASAVLTPRLDLCGVAGVMRRVILREAQRVGVPIQECVLGAADLEGAEEVFLSSALAGILPVNSIDQRGLSIGPITRSLQAALQPLLEEPVDD